MLPEHTLGRLANFILSEVRVAEAREATTPHRAKGGDSDCGPSGSMTSAGEAILPALGEKNN